MATEIESVTGVERSDGRDFRIGVWVYGCMSKLVNGFKTTIL
jgi:hypothetical protein